MILASAASAQTQTTFSDADWLSMGGVPGADLAVRASTVDEAGNVYIGGDFSVVGDVAARGVAKWDGVRWSALGNGIDSGVYALAASGTNVYVAGGFQYVGGISAKNIARWDGSRWSNLGSGLNDTVFALAASGSNLYAGGVFTNAGGIRANRVARWDGRSWSSLGTGVTYSNIWELVSDNNTAVYALAVSGSDLYVGGYFTIAGGTSANRIARWNGTSWSGLGAGMLGPVDWFVDYATVYSVAVSGSKVYAGGYFATAGGFAVTDIAAWDGKAWAPMSGVKGTVFDLAALNGEVYAAGDITDGSGAAVHGVVKWNGQSWSSLEPVDGDVNTLTVSGGKLYVGGAFVVPGGRNVARWDGTGWGNLGNGLNESVSAVALCGTNLYIGGGFSGGKGSGVNHIARWSGTDWAPLQSGVDKRVRAMVASGSDLYVAGDFTSAGAITVNHVAKWNGVGWSPVGEGFDDAVFALAMSGSDLYAGGRFTQSGGKSMSRIARWNGSTWTAVGSGMDDTVLALAVSGGDVYAGGNFIRAGGVTANCIARWDGTAWYPLGKGVVRFWALDVISVDALVVMGSELYVGGRFDWAGNTDAQCLAKWDGTEWSNPIADSKITSVDSLVSMGGDLYGSGTFGQANQNYVFRWNGNTCSLLGSAVNRGVETMCVSGDQLYVGGGFTIAGEKVSGYLARASVVNGRPPWIIAQPDRQFPVVGSDVTLVVGVNGAAPLDYQWQKDGVGLEDDDHISGANGWSLTLKNAQVDDSGNYRLIVSNAWGVAISSSAKVTVLAEPPTYEVWGGNQFQTWGEWWNYFDHIENTGYVLLGKGSRSASFGGDYLWYLIRALDETRVDAVGFSDGSYLDDFWGSNLDDSDLLLGPPDGDSGVLIGDGSFIVFKRNGRGTNLTVIVASQKPDVAVQPTDQTVQTGMPAVMSFFATGSQPLTFRWRKDNLPVFDSKRLFGADSTTLRISEASSNDIGGYDVVVSNRYGSVTSLVARLTVVPNTNAPVPPYAWVKRVASSSVADGYPLGAAVDSAGNIVIAGWFDGASDFGGTSLVSHGGQDIFVAKYGSNGALGWVKGAGCAWDEWEFARAVGTDGKGNVYVTGGFAGEADFGAIKLAARGGATDFFLAKYNSSGGLEWVRQSTDTSFNAYGTGIAVDADGNCVVVGCNHDTVTFGTTAITHETAQGSFIVRYNAAGEVQWARGLQGAISTSVELDSGGNCYVGGTFDGRMPVGTTELLAAGGRDGFLLKYNSSGSVEWARQQIAGGVGGCNFGMNRKTGECYVFGGLSGSVDLGELVLTNQGASGVYLAKYDSAGGLAWARTADGTAPLSGLDQGGCTVDDEGNAYIVGNFSGSLDFGDRVITRDLDWDSGTDGFAAKYDGSGALKWVYTFGGDDADVIPVRTVVDAAHNCYAIGWFLGTANFGTKLIRAPAQYSIFLTRINEAGGCDNTPPALVAVTPGNGAFDVPINTKISFTFSEPMSPGYSVEWSENAWGERTNYWSADGRTLTCAFLEPLPEGAVIKWTLNPFDYDGSFCDFAGNLLPENMYWGAFTTGTNSAPELGVMWSKGQPVIKISGKVGDVYDLLASPVLQVITNSAGGGVLDMSTFASIGRFTNGAGGMEIYVPEPFTNQARFYRARPVASPR